MPDPDEGADPGDVSRRRGVQAAVHSDHARRSVDIALTRNGSPVRWQVFAKDGADLPESLRLVGDAAIRTNTGETFVFLWTATEPGEATLSVRYERFLEVAEIVLRQTLFLC